MASYFGEVLGLKSRAVDDDDLTEIEQVGELLLDFTDEFQNFSADVVICAIGKMGVAFTSSYFRSCDAECVGHAKIKLPLPEDNLIGLKYPKEPKLVAKFFVNPSNARTLICEVTVDIPEELCFSFSQHLLSMCSSSSQCVLFNSLHLSSYRSAADCFQYPFIKCLMTSARYEGLLRENLPFLEPPNIVTNLPAAIMTDFQAAGYCASLFTCYADASDLNSEVIKLFDIVFEVPSINQNMHVIENAHTRLLNYCSKNQKLTDNLYL